MDIVRLNTIAAKLLPQKKKSIVFYGRSMLYCNSIQLIRYLIANGYNKKYKIYLVCTDKKATAQFDGVQNVYIEESKFGGLLKTLTAKYVFTETGYGKAAHVPVKGQYVINLWHGTALKVLGEKPMYGKIFSHTLCAGEFARKYFAEIWNLDDEKIYRGGYPSSDALFGDNDVLAKFSIDRSAYDKVIVYMPTFRKSDRAHWVDSDAEIPLLDSENIEELTAKLAEKKTLLIIKPHPLQNDVGLFEMCKGNMMVLKNDDLFAKGSNIYDILSCSDALITDYSSIYFEYLLTDKPIGFAIEDIDSYGKNRGFIVDDPLEFMPGKKILNARDLIDFIDDIGSGKDQWKEERERIRKLTNYYEEAGGYCRKILDYIGIKA